MSDFEFVLLGTAIFVRMGYQWTNQIDGGAYFPIFLLIAIFLTYETPNLPPLEKEGYPTAPIVRFR